MPGIFCILDTVEQKPKNLFLDWDMCTLSQVMVQDKLLCREMSKLPKAPIYISSSILLGLIG